MKAMTYLTPYQIAEAIKWKTKPSTELFMKVAAIISENIVEINEMISEAISQGKTEIDIDPNNLITIN
jgi:hypothetical protein